MSRPEYYDWDGRVIHRGEWVRLFAQERHIGQDVIDGFTISTVWLGIDHNYWSNGPPLIFESMVFDADGNDIAQERYSTRHAALAGHDQLVARYRTLARPPKS